MFTGIVEERGEVLAVDPLRLVVASRSITTGLGLGDSVAVNGVCLTLVEQDTGSCTFDLSEETLARTTLGRLEPGSPVNLERPVTLASRLGGHLVQGHVDGVGTVTTVAIEGEKGVRIGIAIPEDLLRFIVEKGTIAVDGVSLTVAAMLDDGVETALIPHTVAATTLGDLSAGDLVNVEVDMIAKYVDRLVGGARR